MPRYCLLGHVDANRLDDYREAHRAVWPELLKALREHRLAQLFALPAR